MLTDTAVSLQPPRERLLFLESETGKEEKSYHFPPYLCASHYPAIFDSGFKVDSNPAVGHSQGAHLSLDYEKMGTWDLDLKSQVWDLLLQEVSVWYWKSHCFQASVSPSMKWNKSFTRCPSTVFCLRKLQGYRSLVSLIITSKAGQLTPFSWLPLLFFPSFSPMVSFILTLILFF